MWGCLGGGGGGGGGGGDEVLLQYMRVASTDVLSHFSENKSLNFRSDCENGVNQE